MDMVLGRREQEGTYLLWPREPYGWWEGGGPPTPDSAFVSPQVREMSGWDELFLTVSGDCLGPLCLGGECLGRGQSAWAPCRVGSVCWFGHRTLELSSDAPRPPPHDRRLIGALRGPHVSTPPQAPQCVSECGSMFGLGHVEDTAPACMTHSVPS